MDKLFKMNNIRRCVVLFGLLLFFTTGAFAQAPPPNNNPPGAPIDGMVAILLSVGVGYGMYRSKRNDH